MPERVLIVEDDAHLRELLGIVLARQGFEVITADGGWQALALMASVRPDAVIADLGMAAGDGLELAIALRSSERWANTPVLVLTGHPETEARVQRLRQLPLVAVVGKPPRFAELGGLVRAMIGSAACHEPVRLEGRAAAPVGERLSA